MKIYLLRHAIAAARTAAPKKSASAAKVTHPDDRPLTERGIKRFRRAVKGLTQLIPTPDLILSSPLIRALDTARMFADAVGYKSPIKISELLLPGAPPVQLRALLSKHRSLSHVVVVGHEPELSEFAGLLLDARGSFIELKKSAACCIEFNHARSFEHGTLLWLLQPKTLRLIGRSSSKKKKLTPQQVQNKAATPTCKMRH